LQRKNTNEGEAKSLATIFFWESEVLVGGLVDYFLRFFANRKSNREFEGIEEIEEAKS